MDIEIQCIIAPQIDVVILTHYLRSFITTKPKASKHLLWTLQTCLAACKSRYKGVDEAAIKSLCNCDFMINNNRF